MDRKLLLFAKEVIKYIHRYSQRVTFKDELSRPNWGDLEVEEGAQIQLTFERILYLPPLIRDRLSSPSEIQYLPYELLV